MRRHAHKSALLILVLLLMVGLPWVRTPAQTTITYSDIQATYAVGNRFSFYSDTSGTSVFVGTASGTAQTWDFRALPFSSQSSGISIAPASAPQFNQFPTANIATYSMTRLASGDSIEGYSYHQLTSSMLLFLGAGGTDTSVTRYSPPLAAMKVPCAYNTTWNYQSDTNHIIPGLMWVVTTTNHIVDAFGTLRVPAGDFPALRMKRTTFTYSYNLFTGLSRKKSISYAFMTRGIVEATVSLDTTQENLSTVIPDNVIYSKPGTSDVKLLVGAESPSEFSLEQNYPNPFNPITHFELRVAKTVHVALRVFDALGKEVAMLINENLAAGRYTITFAGERLTSGVYFYRVQAGGFTSVRKMIFMK